MSVTPAKLRQLHRLLRQIGDLKSRLEQGPRRMARSKAVVTQHEERVAEAKESLHKSRTAVNEQQAQLQQREDRIAQLKARLPACTSNKEYQQLDEQIAADEQANDVMSVEIFERLEKMEQLEADLAEKQAALKKAEQDLSKVEAEVDEKRQQLEAELDRVKGQLDEAESTLPAEFMQDYKRISLVRGEDALAEVQGGSCGGCFQTLTPQTMNLLHMGRPVVCICGCVLYLPEDAELPG